MMRFLSYGHEHGGRRHLVVCTCNYLHGSAGQFRKGDGSVGVRRACMSMHMVVNIYVERTPDMTVPPASLSDQAVWERVLTLHAQVERTLAEALQRGHHIGPSE